MDDIENAIQGRIRTGIKKGDVEGVMSLIDIRQLKVITPFGTWLHVAVKHGQLQIVKRLVSMGVDVNAQGGIMGGGAIGPAAREGHIEIVRYLIDHGADLDVRDPQWNPLFSAILGGHIDVAKLLIERGIDTKIKYTGESMKGMDAKAFATERGQTDIASLLAETV